MNRLFLCIVLFALYPCASGAQWQSLTYDTDKIACMSGFAARDGTIIALGEAGTVATLDDNGTLNYVTGGRDEPSLVCGCHGVSDTLWSYTSEGTAKWSLQGQLEWTTTSVDLAGEVLTCASNSAGVQVITTRNAVYRVSKGATDVVSTEQNARVFTTSNDRFLLASESGELLYSDSVGDEWKVANIFPSVVVDLDTVGDRTVCLAANGALFVSEIGSIETWSQISSLPTAEAKDVASFNDSIVVSAWNGPFVSMYISGDHGETWVGGGLSSANFVPNQITTSKAGLLVHGERGFYRFVKQGSTLYDSTTFSQQGVGVGKDAARLPTWRSICRLTDDVWYATSTSPNGLWQSVDDARSWQQEDGGVVGTVTEYKRVLEANGSLMVLVDSLTLELVDGQWEEVHRYELRRRDAVGGGWLAVQAEYWGQDAEDMVYLPSGKVVLYGSDSTYVYTHNLQRMPNMLPPAERRIRDMAVSRSGTLVYLSEHIGVSTDDGETWRTYPRPDESKWIPGR